MALVAAESASTIRGSTFFWSMVYDDVQNTVTLTSTKTSVASGQPVTSRIGDNAAVAVTLSDSSQRVFDLTAANGGPQVVSGVTFKVASVGRNKCLALTSPHTAA